MNNKSIVELKRLISAAKKKIHLTPVSAHEYNLLQKQLSEYQDQLETIEIAISQFKPIEK